jgi:hypothetical protein
VSDAPTRARFSECARSRDIARLAPSIEPRTQNAKSFGKTGVFHAARKNIHLDSKRARSAPMRRATCIKRNFAPKNFFEKCAQDFGE